MAQRHHYVRISSDKIVGVSNDDVQWKIGTDGFERYGTHFEAAVPCHYGEGAQTVNVKALRVGNEVFLHYEGKSVDPATVAEALTIDLSSMPSYLKPQTLKYPHTTFYSHNADGELISGFASVNSSGELAFRYNQTNVGAFADGNAVIGIQAGWPEDCVSYTLNEEDSPVPAP